MINTFKKTNLIAILTVLSACGGESGNDNIMSPTTTLPVSDKTRESNKKVYISSIIS